MLNTAATQSIHWPFFSGALTLTALNALDEVCECASLWNMGALDWSVCWAADTWCNTNLLLALQGPCALMHECVCVCVCILWVLVRNRLDKWMGGGESVWRLDRKEVSIWATEDQHRLDEPTLNGPLPPARRRRGAPNFSFMCNLAPNSTF